MDKKEQLSETDHLNFRSIRNDEELEISSTGYGYESVTKKSEGSTKDAGQSSCGGL